MPIIPLTGGAYQHASQDVNCQRCINLMPTEIGPNGLGSDDPLNQPSMEGIAKGALIRAPGCLELINLGGQQGRGCFTINNKYVYVVVDNSLYQLVVNDVSLTATSTLIGQLNTFTGPVQMRNNPTQLIVVDGSPTAYVYMPLTWGTCQLGSIGGTTGNTYNLTINGIAIYTAQNVATALTPAALIAQINLFIAQTGITAINGGTVSNVTTLNLQANSSATITVVESGTGFVSGTNGITVTGGNFASGSVAAYQVIGATQGYNGGSTIVYNDGYGLYNQVGTETIWNSNLNDFTTWPALQYFSAETKPCIVQGLAVNKGEVWVLADTLVEVWYDAANAPPGSPYSYRVGSGMDVGCQAPHSIVEMNLINVWLDQRGFVCQSDLSPYIRNNNSGYSMRIVSTPALHAEWATYSTIRDAIGTYYCDRGHICYMITFPTQGKTWVYDFPTKPLPMHGEVGTWHERTYTNLTTGLQEFYLLQYMCQFNQLTLGVGQRSGKVYMFSYKYYTDDGAPINCLRRTAPFTNDFKEMSIDKLSLRMETGESLQTGDGSNPQVMLRYSVDGSHTWSDYLAMDMGEVGNFNKKIIWNRLGYGDEWVFEFSVQSPIDFSLIKLSGEVSSVEGM